MEPRSWKPILIFKCCSWPYYLSAASTLAVYQSTQKCALWRGYILIFNKTCNLIRGAQTFDCISFAISPTLIRYTMCFVCMSARARLWGGGESKTFVCLLKLTGLHQKLSDRDGAWHRHETNVKPLASVHPCQAVKPPSSLDTSSALRQTNRDVKTDKSVYLMEYVAAGLMYV